MLLKGIVVETPTSKRVNKDIYSNKYKVRVPSFESAGVKERAILNCTLCYLGNNNPILLIDDIVYIGFENNDINTPVILGKLDCDKNKEHLGEVNLNDSLEVLKVTQTLAMPQDTTYRGVNLNTYIQNLIDKNISNKQDKLIAGNNITIENNVISASGGGSGEPDNYLVSASVSGNNLTLTPNTGNPIVYSPASVNWGDIQGTLSNQTDLQEALDEKLELYEVTQSDIDSFSGNTYVFTEEFSQKLISMKYILKISSALIGVLDPLQITYLKPAYYIQTTIDGDLVKVYEYSSAFQMFETGIDIYLFIYNDTTHKCSISTGNMKTVPVPQTLMVNSNSIQLNTGDVGIGTEVHFATINNQNIVDTSDNIETPNDYHEPRFNSGLSIASSSNISEIYVPYATSSTYGVLQDIYYPNSNPSNFVSQAYVSSELSKYIPLSGTTSLYGNIIPSVNNAMLGNRSNPFFAIYADEVNTSNVYIGDTNDGANLYWDGEYTIFGIGTAGYFEINNTSKYGRSGIALTTEGQFTYNGNEVATVNQINDATLTIQVNSSTIGTFTANASNSSVINVDLSEYATSSFIAANYVPYSGASKAVNLGTNSFYAENIYGNNIGLLLAGTTFQGFNFYDGDVNLLTGGGPLYINTNSGGAYYDGEEIATKNWVGTNSFASFHASSLYASTIIINNRTLSGVYTKSEALAILNGTSSVS